MKKSKYISIYKEAWELIVAEPAIRDLSTENQQLVDNIARIGYSHAHSKEVFQEDLLSYMYEWANQCRPNTTLFAEHSGYSTYIVSKDVITQTPSVQESVKKGEQEYMRRLIPISYAMIGSLFLALSLLFAFSFYMGAHGGKFIIGPFTNLMLLIASIGLTATVIAAIVEWRKLQGGNKK